MIKFTIVHTSTQYTFCAINIWFNFDKLVQKSSQLYFSPNNRKNHMMTSESIQVLIKYDGTWDKHETYKNYKATGMLLSCDSDYEGLCNAVKNSMNLTNTNYNLTFSYKMDNDFPPITISSDYNIAFYIDLKRTVSDAMKFSLCIDKDNY